jgi:hypothetical protein
MNRLVVKSRIVRIIQGRKIIPVTTTARILGIKVKVISWIWVTDWNMLTNTPTSSPAPNIGAEINKQVFIASRKISDTVSGVISILP